MTRMIWLVEASYDHGPWHSTVGVALTRSEGREVLRDWHARNPDDRFRLRRYAALRERLGVQ